MYGVAEFMGSIDYVKLSNSLQEVLLNTKMARSPVSQDLVNYSLAGGASVNVNKYAGTGWSVLVATVRAAYASTATAGVRVLWLYSQDGTNFDSVNDAMAQGNYYDLSFAAGGTAQATLFIPLLAPYVQILIINKDSSNAATVNLWTLFLS